MRIKPIFSKEHGVSFQDGHGNRVTIEKLKQCFAGQPASKQSNGHLQADFDELQTVPASELAKYGLSDFENVTFYRIQQNKDTLIIPAITLLSGVFKPFDKILTNPSLGFWETRVMPRFRDGRTIFEAHSSLRGLTGINANVHPNALAPFIFLSMYPSAQYCFYSFINNCIGGTIGPNRLPLGKFSCVIQKQSIGSNTLLVTDLTMLHVEATEEPQFDIHQSKIVEFRSTRNLTENGKGRIGSLDGIPTTGKNEVTVSDEEWRTISVVLDKGCATKYQPREVFNAILVKLHERKPWAEANNVSKETLCARYRTWTQTGQFQQSLNLLREMRVKTAH